MKGKVELRSFQALHAKEAGALTSNHKKQSSLS